MEERRRQITAEDISRYFERLAEALEGGPAHFVYDVDEMGHCKWVNRQEQMRDVPTGHSHARVYLPFPRTGKCSHWLIYRR
jgi:hypothetical protein